MSSLARKKLVQNLPNNLPTYQSQIVSLRAKILAMPKMKTHSGAKKRMKKTGSGKLKSYQAYTSHRMRNKSKKAKRKLLKAVIVHPSEEKRMKKLLGIF